MTNIDVLKQFMDINIACEAIDEDRWFIQLGSQV